MIVNWFLYFIVYSFCGWVYESILCSIKEKKLINRGFLTGPIIPVYGTGALLVIAVFQHHTDNLAILFISGVLLTGSLEYLTGFLLETLFHMKWWDYSNHRFNLQGRICLQSVTVFGAMSSIIVKYIHPLVANAIAAMPANTSSGLAACIFLILVMDFAATLNHLIHLDKKLKRLQAAWDHFVAQEKQHAKHLEDSLHAKFSFNAYDEQDKNLQAVRRFQDKRLSLAFPRARHLLYTKAWEKLRALIG